MELHTDVWVAALVRRCELGGAFATVVRKGEARSGAALVKTIDRRDGVAKLYEQAFRGAGESVWMRPLVSTIEADVDAYVERAVRFDPDVWVVEIEDRDGRRFLTETVEDDVTT